MPKLIYLASPYTHEDPLIEIERFKAACKAAGEMFASGHFVFSSIAHCHPIALEYGLPTDFKFFADYDRLMIDKCDELIVLRLDGWKDSVGVKGEVRYAESIGLQVRYI